MATSSKGAIGPQFKELGIEEARRLFTRKRGRSSKCNQILAAAENLGSGKALYVEQLKYAEVSALRKKVPDQLGERWKIEATKGRLGFYDVIVYSED